MMLNYKAISGGEVLYYDGQLYFWTAFGVYSVKASTLKRHGQIDGPREVSLTIMDTERNYGDIVHHTYPADFDDYEIIYRLISGTAACDCSRGQMLYGPTLQYKCNRGPNRFVISKMAIKGEKNSTEMIFRRFV